MVGLVLLGLESGFWVSALYWARPEDRIPSGGILRIKDSFLDKLISGKELGVEDIESGIELYPIGYKGWEIPKIIKLTGNRFAFLWLKKGKSHRLLQVKIVELLNGRFREITTRTIPLASSKRIVSFCVGSLWPFNYFGVVTYFSLTVNKKERDFLLYLINIDKNRTIQVRFDFRDVDCFTLFAVSFTKKLVTYFVASYRPSHKRMNYLDIFEWLPWKKEFLKTFRFELTELRDFYSWVYFDGFRTWLFEGSYGGLCLRTLRGEIFEDYIVDKENPFDTVPILYKNHAIAIGGIPYSDIGALVEDVWTTNWIRRAFVYDLTKLKGEVKKVQRINSKKIEIPLSVRGFITSDDQLLARDFGYRIKEMTASEEVPGGEAANIRDGDWVTGWGVKGKGIGKWVKIEFTDESDIDELWVLPGDFSSEENWKLHNRVAEAEIELSDGKKLVAKFKDEMDIQRVQIGAKIKWLKFKIKKIYKGKEGGSTYVAEIIPIKQW